MRVPGIVLTVFASLGLVACKDVVPAVIVDADEASHAALKVGVNSLLNTDVLLAPGAFTDTSSLTIERREMLGPDGTPLQGRHRDPVIQLRLVTDGKRCILVDLRDESRHVLANVACEAESG